MKSKAKTLPDCLSIVPYGTRKAALVDEVECLARELSEAMAALHGCKYRYCIDHTPGIQLALVRRD